MRMTMAAVMTVLHWGDQFKSQTFHISTVVAEIEGNLLIHPSSHRYITWKQLKNKPTVANPFLYNNKRIETPFYTPRQMMHLRRGNFQKIEMLITNLEKGRATIIFSKHISYIEITQITIELHIF
jgi:hypothetical protein